MLAFGLRVARLGFTSLWNDEVNGVEVSLQSFSGITRWVAANDAHPPLSYWLLHAWMLGAGSTEYGARALSVVFGVLSVATLYVLLRELTGRVRSWLGVAALAASPFAVYYSQEARMEMEACFFVLLAAVLLLRAFRRGKSGVWLAYAAAATAALHSFYPSAAALLALNLPALIRGPRPRAWWLANAGAVLACVPWLALVVTSTRRFRAEPRPAGPPVDWLGLPHVLAQYAFGPTLLWRASLVPAMGLLGALLLCCGALLLRGDWPPPRARTEFPDAGPGKCGAVPAAGGMLLLWAFVPPIAIYAATLVAAGQGDSAPRLALISLPAWIAILVAGWPARWRLPVVAWVAILVVLGLPAGRALATVYTNVENRDDYRAIFAVLRQQALPDQALVYDLPEQAAALRYYGGSDDVPAYGLPASPSERQTDQQLATLTSKYTGIWAMLYGEPTPWVENWLDAHAIAVSNDWYGPYVRLKHYLVEPVAADQPRGVGVMATFGPLELRQIRVKSPSPTAIPLGLLWQTSGAGTAQVRSLQLFDQSDRRVAQADGPPVGDALPTTRWLPGAVYDDPVVLHPSPPLPSGLYTLKATVYTTPSQALPLASVLRLAVEAHPNVEPVHATASAGWQIDDISFDKTADGLVLQVDGAVQFNGTTDFTWFAHLLDGAGKLVSQDDRPPLLPTSRWQAGDAIDEAFALSGTGADVEVGAYDAAGKRVIFTLADGRVVDHLTLPDNS